MNNKRKVPTDWVTDDTKPSVHKQTKTDENHFHDDSDLDQLLGGINFDDLMETEGSSSQVTTNGHQNGTTTSEVHHHFGMNEIYAQKTNE